MKTLTAIAVTLVVAAVLGLPFFLWYLPHEGAMKDRVMSVPRRAPIWIERRILVYDCLASYWYIIALGVVPTTFVTALIGGRGHDQEKG